MSRRKSSVRWMPLRCEASMQSPATYGSNALGVEAPTHPPGYVACPVCWKKVKLLRLMGFGSSRIPNHNVDHDRLSAKEAAMETARIDMGTKQHIDNCNARTNAAMTPKERAASDRIVAAASRKATS